MKQASVNHLLWHSSSHMTSYLCLSLLEKPGSIRLNEIASFEWCKAHQNALEDWKNVIGGRNKWYLVVKRGLFNGVELMNL